MRTPSPPPAPSTSPQSRLQRCERPLLGNTLGKSWHGCFFSLFGRVNYSHHPSFFPSDSFLFPSQWLSLHLPLLARKLNNRGETVDRAYGREHFAEFLVFFVSLLLFFSPRLTWKCGRARGKASLFILFFIAVLACDGSVDVPPCSCVHAGRRINFYVPFFCAPIVTAFLLFLLPFLRAHFAWPHLLLAPARTSPHHPFSSCSRATPFAHKLFVTPMQLTLPKKTKKSPHHEFKRPSQRRRRQRLLLVHPGYDRNPSPSCAVNLRPRFHLGYDIGFFEVCKFPECLFFFHTFSLLTIAQCFKDIPTSLGVCCCFPCSIVRL